MEDTFTRAEQLKLPLKKKVIHTLSTYVSGQDLINDIQKKCLKLSILPDQTEVYLRTRKWGDGKELVISCIVNKSLEELNEDIEEEEKLLKQIEIDEIATLKRLKKKWGG